MSARLVAAIVDWAGTIVDFGSRAPAGAFVELYRRHGVTVTTPEARGPMGMGKRDHVAALGRLDSVARQWTERHGRAMTDDDVEALYREFIPLQIACLPDYADVIPGAVPALAAWRARGLRIGSTTGYSREMVDICAAAARRQGLEVDCIVCASDVSAGRPAPWMALQAAARLGAYPMRAVVKIGDTFADIDEGLNAGMWTIGISGTGNELGLSATEVAALDPEAYAAAVEPIEQRMLAAGA
jgi:phosphonoacetaldehyde hydrolase